MQQPKHLGGVAYVETDAEGTILRLAGGGVSSTSAVGKNIETLLPGQVGITLAARPRRTCFPKGRAFARPGTPTSPTRPPTARAPRTSASLVGQSSAYTTDQYTHPVVLR